MTCSCCGKELDRLVFCSGACKVKYHRKKPIESVYDEAAAKAAKKGKKGEMVVIDEVITDKAYQKTFQNLKEIKPIELCKKHKVYTSTCGC